MIDDDFVILGLPGLLSYSKSRHHREQVFAVVRTLVDFLQDNGLTNDILISRDQQLSDSFVIRRRDLTDEGYDFYQRVEQKWLCAVDQGNRPTDSSILARELSRLRGK